MRIALCIADRHKVAFGCDVRRDLPDLPFPLISTLDGERPLAEVLILALPGPAQVDAVIKTIVRGPKLPAIVVDHSTLDPSATERSKAQCDAAGIRHVAAPLIGGPRALGTPESRCISTRAEIDGVEDVVGLYTRPVFIEGDSAVSAAAKLLHNYVTLSNAFGLAGALQNLRAGLTRDSFLDVVRAGTANSYVARHTIARSVAGEAGQDGYSVVLALKDVRLIEALAPKLPQLGALRKAFEEYLAHGGDGEREYPAAFGVAVNERSPCLT